MSDLHLATAAPITVNLAGRAYEIAPLKMKTMGRAQQWIDEQPWTDPVEELKALKDDLDHDIYKSMMAIAYQRKLSGRELMMGGGGELLLRSDAGRRLLFAFILRERQPDVTDAEVDEAYGDCTMVELLKLFAMVTGAPDPTAPDPKAPGPATDGVS